jgi:hypothetical protein
VGCDQPKRLAGWPTPKRHVNSAAGTIYTEAPNDSGVPGFIGTVDLTTGFIHPVMIGFGHPTGMAYVPDATP